jgi:hypothetical protein
MAAYATFRTRCHILRSSTAIEAETLAPAPLFILMPPGQAFHLLPAHLACSKALLHHPRHVHALGLLRGQ